MLKYLLQVSIFFYSLTAFAQKEGANWYFGDHAGLDFNPSVPVALTNGQLIQDEGCATISSNDGILLFYTNGITIYNANHVVMQNGAGLMGHDSSSQSAIIVPFPGDPTKYYVFAVDAEGGPKGLTYSVVDMTLDGGLGGVVPAQKNIQLVTPIAEKLTAVYHSNKQDIWVITHSMLGNQFLAYLVTSAGISTPPVISSLGTNYFAGIGTLGCMKASPDGRMLATAKYAFAKGLELFDFDSSTGVLSNARQLQTNSCYGVEFSPNSKVLYCSAVTVSPFFLLQYDLSSPNLESIQASAFVVSGQPYGALQIGIDGKMYAAKYDESNIAVINNPNELGAGCDFSHIGPDLGGKMSKLGLPCFIQTYFIQEIEAAPLCLGNPTLFTIRSGIDPVTASWNFGDGITSTALAPEHLYVGVGTYTVSVDYTTNAGPDIIHLEKEITILTGAIAHGAADLRACKNASSNGFSEFSLSGQTAIVLGGQSAADYTVTYHATEELALAGEDPLPLDYTNTSNPQTIHARVTNNQTGCYAISSFDLVVSPIPTITTPDDLVACEEEQGVGRASFDLWATIPQITGGAANVVVQFFKTPGDMASNIPIAPPSAYVNSTPYSQTVYFKAYAAGLPDCSATGELDLVVHPIPVLNSNIPDYVLCDENGSGDGREEFDLTSRYSQITSEPGYVLTYFYEQSGSLVVIDDPSSFENTVPGQQTVFVSTSNSFTCENTTSFVVRVAPLPVIADAGPFQGCEESPGQGAFDLDALAAAVSGGAPGITVVFYATQAQAESGNPDEALGSPHTSGTGTLYALVKAATTGCEIIVPVGLEVIPAPVAHQPGNLRACDTDGTNDGLYGFDLAAVEAEVLGTQDPAIHAITFHTSLEDANTGQHAIGNPSSYQSVMPLLQQIWVRLVNTATANGCPAITSFLLQVERLPEPLLEGGAICVDFVTGQLLGSYVLDSGLSAAYYSFVWYRDGGIIAGASTGTLEVTEAGSYSVVATSLAGGCVSEPLAPVKVEQSGPAIPIGTGYTVTNAFSENPTITVLVQGHGQYRYSLDYGPYQDSNVFYNVSPGLHTVHVSAENSCDDLVLHIEDIRIIDYPKFFTPNGDGYNDTWNIRGLPDFPVSTIYIFDRYGKLLLQLDPRNVQGWDGTYNGAAMPSTDYWFTISYPENGVMKEFRAHFALKR